MESVKELAESIKEEKQNNKENFFSFVFDFDKENQGRLLNLFQYTFLVLPLVFLTLKSINYLTPAENEEKASLEICAEILITISVILLSIWFIDKIVRFIPTYSKLSYFSFNEINFIIPFLIILLTMQTKLGLKVNMLFERIVDIWEGKGIVSSQTDYKKKQPIAASHANRQIIPQHQPSRSDYVDSVSYSVPPQGGSGATQLNGATTSFNNLMHETKALQPSPGTGAVSQQDFNSFFQGPNMGLPDSQIPGAGVTEPMAANEAMGGMFGGSTF